uniref:Uncharacterized protein n=1 Tax=Octopus bimaculoides TaxID=37653 RepID=A0A0L8HSC3_OCTBM
MAVLVIICKGILKFITEKASEEDHPPSVLDYEQVQYITVSTYTHMRAFYCRQAQKLWKQYFILQVLLQFKFWF